MYKAGYGSVVFESVRGVGEMKKSIEKEVQRIALQKEIKRVTSFFKEAFCIDGEVRILPGKEAQVILANCTINIVELNDSKRGKLYIGAIKKKVEK